MSDNNPYHYTIEKLTTALEVLATHPGDARERVAAAFGCCFTLQEDDFPPKHAKKWKALIREITKYPPAPLPKGVVMEGTGAIDVWARTVRKSTGKKMAKLLWELYWAVSENTRYY